MSLQNVPLYPFSNITNTTGEEHTPPLYLGFISAGVSVFFFGTAFLPIKKFEPSDGMFYQWVLASGILSVGIIINIIRHSPQFYPFVMLGGALWALGNVCVVVIVKTVGMGVGMCVWNVSNLLAGWASGRFGLFGTIARPPSNILMNYFGVALAVVSVFVYTLIRPKLADIEMTILVTEEEVEPLLAQSRRQSTTINSDPNPPQYFYENLSSLNKRLIGIVLSLVSGLFYGFCFIPAIYVQDHYAGASQNGLDYVFSQFVGIYSTSLVFVFVYTALRRNRPTVNTYIILPGIISGVMWGIATAAWFLAIQILTETIAFPIVTTGPAVVCNLFTVFIFKEVSGLRDLLILSVGIAMTVAACIVTGISK